MNRSFVLGISLMFVVAIGGLIVLMVRHERRAELCKSIGGITVQTPEGWHCLTKADLK